MKKIPFVLSILLVSMLIVGCIDKKKTDSTENAVETIEIEQKIVGNELTYSADSTTMKG